VVLPETKSSSRDNPQPLPHLKAATYRHGGCTPCFVCACLASTVVQCCKYVPSLACCHTQEFGKTKIYIPKQEGLAVLSKEVGSAAVALVTRVTGGTDRSWLHDMPGTCEKHACMYCIPTYPHLVSLSPPLHPHPHTLVHPPPQELDAAKAELKGLQEQLLAANKGVREAEAGAPDSGSGLTTKVACQHASMLPSSWLQAAVCRCLSYAVGRWLSGSKHRVRYSPGTPPVLLRCKEEAAVWVVSL
jgi:hypothetical protein